MKHASCQLLSLTGLVWLAALTPGLLAAASPSVEPAAHLSSTRHSADAGSADAQLLLGIRYYNGDGVRSDLRQAARWFELAAAQGDRTAEYELGAMYQSGEGGLARDDRRAIQFYTQSAQQGFEAANLVLGIDYELGDGIPRSRSQAIANLLRGGRDGLFVATALAAGNTPARLDGALALGNFLAAIRGSPLPPGWNRLAMVRRRAGEPVTLASVLTSKRHDEKSSTK